MSYNNNVRNKKRGSNTNKFILGGLLSVCIFGVLVFFLGNREKPVPHHNLIDEKISQYSDKHITLNAIVADLEFKNIVFDSVAPARQPLFLSQIAAVVKSIKSLVTTPKESVKEYGSWIWTPIMNMTPEYMEEVLSGAKADGVNTIYVSVDTYLDIFVMPKGKEREEQKKAFGDKLEDFIIRANRKGIAVDAEGGWRNWAEGDNIYKAFAIVSYVKNFNTEHKNKFRGFQYDVEPYLLDSYQKDKASVLGNFVKLVDQTENFMGTSTLRFSVVVPDFYDEKDGFTPKFSYNGENGYTFKHLLNILDRRPDSSVIIMSYRNLAVGDDSTVEVSSNEMQTARSGRYDIKIIIAQETGDVPPPYITFHNTSKKYLFSQIEKIDRAFEPYSNFGGIAIHYANAFLALK